MITWFHANAKAKSEAYKYSTCKTKLRNHFKLLYNIAMTKMLLHANAHSPAPPNLMK